MSFLRRLFGGSAPPETAPQPTAPANTVVVADDLAATLTAGGVPLQDAVDTTLREAIATAEVVAARSVDRVPFWLARDDEKSGGIDEALRDRVAQRRAGEDDS